jgi:hypothetical protein
MAGVVTLGGESTNCDSLSNPAKIAMIITATSTASAPATKLHAGTQSVEKKTNADVPAHITTMRIERFESIRT